MLSTVALVGAATFMLGVGAYRRRNKTSPDLALPAAIIAMTWQLTDHLGRIVRPADWAGQPVMVLFGFTRCPDV